MPRSAILTGCVDYVLDPAGIAQELLRITGHPYLASVTDTGTGNLISDTEESDLQKIFAIMRRSTAVDFSRYKRNTILRRVRRRMTLRRVEEMSEYVGMLQNESDEVNALYQDFLIRVTSFFRDPSTVRRSEHGNLADPDQRAIGRRADPRLGLRLCDR